MKDESFLLLSSRTLKNKGFIQPFENKLQYSGNKFKDGSRCPSLNNIPLHDKLLTVYD